MHLGFLDLENDVVNKDQAIVQFLQNRTFGFLVFMRRFIQNNHSDNVVDACRND